MNNSKIRENIENKQTWTKQNNQMENKQKESKWMLKTTCR